MKTPTASDRKSLIRLAASLPKGDKQRRAILAGLNKVSYTLREDKEVWRSLGAPIRRSILTHLGMYGGVPLYAYDQSAKGVKFTALPKSELHPDHKGGNPVVSPEGTFTFGEEDGFDPCVKWENQYGVGYFFPN